MNGIYVDRTHEKKEIDKIINDDNENNKTVSLRMCVTTLD